LDPLDSLTALPTTFIRGCFNIIDGVLNSSFGGFRLSFPSQSSYKKEVFSEFWKQIGNSFKAHFCNEKIFKTKTFQLELIVRHKMSPMCFIFHFVSPQNNGGV
jgi:hypothetical protein